MRARHCSRPAAMRWDPPGWFPEGALGPHFADKEVRFRGGEAAQGLCRGQSAKSGTCGLSAQAPPTHCPRLFCSVPAAAQGLGLRGEGAPARQTRQGGRCRGGPVPLGVGAPPPTWHSDAHVLSHARAHTSRCRWQESRPGNSRVTFGGPVPVTGCCALAWEGGREGEAAATQDCSRRARAPAHTHTPVHAHAFTCTRSHRRGLPQVHGDGEGRASDAPGPAS